MLPPLTVTVTTELYPTQESDSIPLIRRAWSPDSRWRMARLLAYAAGEVRVQNPVDPETAEVVEYFRARRNAAAAREPEGLVEALLLAAADPVQRLLVEGYILADADPATIAERTGHSPAALRRFEELFFSVRNRLRDRSWIEYHATGNGEYCSLEPEAVGRAVRAIAYTEGVEEFEDTLAAALPGGQRFTSARWAERRASLGAERCRMLRRQILVQLAFKDPERSDLRNRFGTELPDTAKSSGYGCADGRGKRWPPDVDDYLKEHRGIDVERHVFFP